MSEKDAVQGLTCPRCGGVVPIPEGQVIVCCPYCDLRSVVRGERGLRHYQAPCRTSRDQAISAFQAFLKRSMAIARDAHRTAQLSETFIAYLPFWAAWGRVMGWAFGEVKVSSGRSSHYEPREKRVVEEMSWNGAACDVGEFGVTRVPLTDQQLEPFNPIQLHAVGLVFEPIGAQTDAHNQAEAEFQERTTRKTRLDRVGQRLVRLVRERLGVVYYPVWIVRYLYRNRVYQVTLDAYSGAVLYGKAPGNTFYRAAMLVGGMALGAFLAVDVPSIILGLTSHASDNSSGNSFGLALVVFAAGLGVAYAAYRRFRYGEEYEYNSGPKQYDLGFTKRFGLDLSEVSDAIRTGIEMNQRVH